MSRQPHVDYGTAKLHRSRNRWGSDRFSSKDRFWSANARMNMAETHHATKHRGGFFAVAALLGTALAGGVAWYASRRRENDLLSRTARRLGLSHTPVRPTRSEEHTSELQSLMRSSYAVLGL